MKNIEVSIWEDDLPEQIMERIAGVLCELGVYVKNTGIHTEKGNIVRHYQFILAEPLPETPDI